MTASVPDDLEAQVRELRALVREMQRPRSRYQPNMRDLRDAALTQVQDGEVPVYSSATGKWVPGAGASGGSGGPPPFTLPGAVATSTSGRWYPSETLTITRLFASLTTAGSTTTTVALLRNGVSVATVSLVAADLAEGVTISQAFTGPESQYMQVQVTAAGTGAQNLVVQVS